MRNTGRGRPDVPEVTTIRNVSGRELVRQRLGRRVRRRVGDETGRPARGRREHHGQGSNDRPSGHRRPVDAGCRLPHSTSAANSR